MLIFGKYSMFKSENFDEYLKSIGVCPSARNILTTANYSTEIKQDGDEYIITTLASFNKTNEIKFKLDVEFEETILDGRKSKSIITLKDDNKLIHNQRWDGKSATIYREFEGNKMTMTLTSGDTSCVRYYTKVH